MDLLSAIGEGKLHVVQEYMDYSTDPNDISIPKGYPLGGAYPLHLEIAKGNPAIVKILLDHGADIEKQASDTNGSQPLHWAVFFCKRMLLKYCLNEGQMLTL